MLHTNTLYLGVSEAVTQAKQTFRRPARRLPEHERQRPERPPDGGGRQGGPVVRSRHLRGPFRPNWTCPTPLQAIWIPEFHGELVLGVSKDSPLASRTDLRLADLAQSRFIMQANRLNERFKEDFIKLCSDVGFYPNISLEPVRQSARILRDQPRRRHPSHLQGRQEVQAPHRQPAQAERSHRAPDGQEALRGRLRPHAQGPGTPRGCDFVATCLAQHAETLRASLIEK